MLELTSTVLKGNIGPGFQRKPLLFGEFPFLTTVLPMWLCPLLVKGLLTDPPVQSCC